MRRTILIGLLVLAGCGGGGATSAQNDAAAAEPPETLPAGQWQLSSEVIASRSTDHGPPRIRALVGDRSTAAACVGGDAQAPTTLFTEPGYDCHYGAYYARGGHINADLRCQKSGLSGFVGITIDGTYTGDRIDYTRHLLTQLSTDGDVAIDTHVTGHRTGPCTPAPAGH
jgi:Protein of unknown function (DUF3617)